MIESNVAADELLIRDALAAHYTAHGLPADGGAADPWFRIRLGPVSLRLPNPPARRRAVLYHDVNHVATGYNTTFSEGEVAIAAFEVGAGCGHFAIAWFFNLCALAIGFVSQPRSALRAFVRGRRSVSIYHSPPSPAAFAAATVGEIRRRLRLDAVPARAHWFDYASFVVWGLTALVVLLVPPVIILTGLWLGGRALVR